MSINRRVLITLIVLLGLELAIAPFVFLNKNQTDVTDDTTKSESKVVPRSIEMPRISSEVMVDGLIHPWDVGFIDDAMLVTERSGKLSKYQNGKLVQIAKIEVVAIGEGGLTGLAIDPNYAANRFVHVCYNSTKDIRIERLELNQAQTEIKSRLAIVTGLPVNTTTYPGRHSGCRPRFGSDGYLWIGTGDVGVGSNPQDAKSLGGKVLRVDRDGRAALGNLAAPFDERIYSYGHRNVQGLAMFSEPRNGLMGYSIEHGSGRDDEVNELVKGNFGWNPVPGYNEKVAMTDKTKYPGSVDAVWRSGKPTIAPSGGTILEGRKWKAWEGALAMAVLKDEHVRILIFDEDGNLEKEIPILSAQYGRIRTAVLGPDQNLYLTTDNGHGDKVIKVIPQ